MIKHHDSTLKLRLMRPDENINENRHSFTYLLTSMIFLAFSLSLFHVHTHKYSHNILYDCQLAQLVSF